AAREHDPQRAEVLQRMSEAEAGHRRRIEARLRELGAALPDPRRVQLSSWTRLQILVAPVDRVLGWRERLEDREAEGIYRAPTGDAETDRLFGEIRKDEASHSLAIQEMNGARAPGTASDAPEGRLKRILARETWHQRG